MGLFDADTVTDPSGVRWDVRRRWHSYRFRWWAPRADFLDLGFFADDMGGLGGILVGIAVVLVVIAFVMFVLPAMLFLAQLLLIALLVTSSVVARLLLGRPWEIVAAGSDGRERLWLVRGWRASGRAITHIAWALQTGTSVQLPDGGREA